jgi:hypothetical protein
MKKYYPARHLSSVFSDTQTEGQVECRTKAPFLKGDGAFLWGIEIGNKCSIGNPRLSPPP